MRTGARDEKEPLTSSKTNRACGSGLSGEQLSRLTASTSVLRIDDVVLLRASEECGPRGTLEDGVCSEVHRAAAPRSTMHNNHDVRAHDAAAGGRSACLS